MQVDDRESNFHRKFHRALLCARPQPQHLGAPGRMDGVFTLSSVSPDTTLAGAAAAYLAHLEAQAALGRTSPHTIAARRYGLRFLGVLERLRLGEIRRSDVIAWAGDLALTAGVVRRVPASLEFSAIRSLQAMLRWCADRDACAVGIASRLATGYRPQPGRSLTHQELGLMRAALAAHDRPGRCPATQVCVQVLRVLALFVNPASGRVVTHHAINKVVKRIAADAGLPEPHDFSPHDFSPHDFRHTFATHAFGAGASLEDVAAALGHTSTAVTKSTYLHNVVSPGARRAHAAAHGRAA